MSTVTFRYNTQWDWRAYDPTNNFAPGQYAMGAQKVHFDGPNKWIVINNGERALDVQIDIYSAWKEWLVQFDNSKYEQALTSIGGDPITATTSVGITYFLENGWRIKLAEEDGDYIFDGNLYTREPGQSPYLPPDGDFDTTVSFNRSNLVDIVTSTASLTNTDITSIAAASASAVWDKPTADIILAGSIGVYIKTQLAKIDGISGIDANTVALAVWDVLLADISSSDTFGDQVKNKLLTKSQFIALQE
jgi:hypothetical protein